LSFSDGSPHAQHQPVSTFRWPYLVSSDLLSFYLLPDHAHFFLDREMIPSCFQETANTSFSPDGRVLVCGSNVRPKSDATGVLKFFDVYTADAEPQLGERRIALLFAVIKCILHCCVAVVFCRVGTQGRVSQHLPIRPPPPCCCWVGALFRRTITVGRSSQCLGVDHLQTERQLVVFRPLCLKC